MNRITVALLVGGLMVTSGLVVPGAGAHVHEHGHGEECEEPTSPQTHTVDDDAGSGDFDTIQAAIDAAQAGDTILVEPGTYDEQLTFYYDGESFTATGYIEDTCHLTIRGNGADPGDVELRGFADADTACETGTDYALFAYDVENVTFENMAALDYKTYGFYWQDVDGFYGYDLLAGDNCVYGIIGHSAQDGVVADSEAYGSGDSGLYIGEIADCRCKLEDNLVHTNVIGYSGTRANGVFLQDNTFENNVVGILPNMLPPEHLHHVVEGRQDPYQCCSVYVDNHVVDNNNVYAEDQNGDGDTKDEGEDGVRPHGFTEGEVRPPSGVGIMLAGANANVVAHNTIEDHDRWGIVVNWLFVPANGNAIMDNVIADSGREDLWWDGQGVNNCWRANEKPNGSPASSDPAVLPSCDVVPVPPATVPRADNSLHLACLATEHGLPFDCSGPAGTLAALVP